MLAALLALSGCPKKDKPPPVERIFLGERTACALLSSGALRCKGRGDEGQLGPAAPPGTRGPAALPVDGAPRAIGFGPTAICVDQRDGAKTCFGAGADVSPQAPGCKVTSGRASCGGARWPAPPRLDGLPGVAEVVEGRAHGCARLEGGTVACWGDNQRGQLAAPPSAAPIDHPVLVQGLFGVTALVAAGDGTCAVLQDKTARCWGDNADGHLSTRHGPILDVPTPVHF